MEVTAYQTIGNDLGPEQRDSKQPASGSQDDETPEQSDEQQWPDKITVKGEQGGHGKDWRQVLYHNDCTAPEQILTLRSYLR